MVADPRFTAAVEFSKRACRWPARDRLWRCRAGFAAPETGSSHPILFFKFIVLREESACRRNEGNHNSQNDSHLRAVSPPHNALVFKLLRRNAQLS